MPKRSSKPSSDPNVTAFQAVQSLTEGKKAKPRKKNPAAVALGRLGGAVGGKRRAAALSPKRRTEIAKKAAKARWSKPS